MKVAILSWLHLYAVIGYEEGISYQIRNARARGGASKDAVLATLEIAFLHSGPLGSAAVARAASDLLNAYEDPRPAPWPAGWQLKPLLGLPRLDATTTMITASELTAIRDWYQAVCGQIPKYVEFLAVHRPAVLKAYLLRFAHADRGQLPGEMIPILQLQLYTVRSCGPGIREAAAMARGLGVAKQFALDAVTRAMIYAGPAAVSVVADSAGDIFAAWSEEETPKDRSRP
jgi:alkylhydroperoxidase/carboxymuconolactone decarboxylase family protein YurZ